MKPLPDLRFKWIGVETTSNELTSVNYSSGELINPTLAPGPSAFTPLGVTLPSAALIPAGDYAWSVGVVSPGPTSAAMSTTAQTDQIANIDHDLDTLGNGVLISLDVLPDAFAFVTIAAASGPTTYKPLLSIDVTADNLSTWVAQQAAVGLVTTALSASPTIAGGIRAYAFGRTGDTTAYETQVVSVTPDTVATEASTLAAGGYYITAFGRVGDNAAVMVGTRTAGAPARTVVVDEAWHLDYAMVGEFLAGTAPNYTNTVIGER